MVVERYYFFHPKPPAATLEILAFDTANTMRRLVSLYNSLTDGQVSKLFNDTIKSKGVTYLNSNQETFLLNLAFAERLEELDLAAATVSRLGRRCSDPGLNQFDLVYADLKAGMINTRKLRFSCRSVTKSVEKMEKLVVATWKLHDAMMCLREMEASEKKVERCKALFGHKNKMNIQSLCDQIAFQRNQVRHYKGVSLWNQTYDKIVRLMVRIIFIIYTRICSVFQPYISGIPTNDRNFDDDGYCLLEHRQLYQTNCCLTTNRVSKSGPISKTNKSSVPAIRFVSEDDKEIAKKGRVLMMAPPWTVGGAGLSFRYANVIMMAERCLHAPVGEGEREAIYEMLPERVKGEVRRKMVRGKWWRKEEEGGDGRSPAEGWREAAEEIMGWLVPVARDTARWRSERSMEKERCDEMKGTTLLLQTLHYSDLDKVEVAIVEVLVALSYVFMYERRRR